MLSNAMLEYAEQLPLLMRREGGRMKEPLRTLAETLAPTLTQAAPKRGFAFPLDRWIRRDLARHWRDWELTPRLAGIGLVPTELNRMVEYYDVAASREDSYRTRESAIRLFDLMILALWMERHGICS